MTEIPPAGSPEPIEYGQSPKPGLFTPPPVPLIEVTDKNARMWGMLCHLSALVQFAGVPSVVGPLVIWLIKKDEIPFANDQGKEALNFHISVMILALIVSPTICLGVGIFVVIGIAIAGLVLSIVAAVKANAGVYYRYPFTIRLIK